MTGKHRRPPTAEDAERMISDADQDELLVHNGFKQESKFRKLAFPSTENTNYLIGDNDPGEFADQSKIVPGTLPPFTPRMGYKTTPPPHPPRVTILREAETLITGERNQTYGEPTQNFTNIADLLTVQFRHKLRDGQQFTPADVAQMQIHTKMARMIAQPKRDNYLDIAGYAACGWECQEGSH